MFCHFLQFFIQKIVIVFRHLQVHNVQFLFKKKLSAKKVILDFLKICVSVSKKSIFDTRFRFSGLQYNSDGWDLFSYIATSANLKILRFQCKKKRIELKCEKKRFLQFFFAVWETVKLNISSPNLLQLRPIANQIFTVFTQFSLFFKSFIVNYYEK